MKNHLGDPICRRVGGLAAPAGTNVCISGSAMQKRSTAGLPKAAAAFCWAISNRETACRRGGAARAGKEVGTPKERGNPACEGLAAPVETDIYSVHATGARTTLLKSGRVFLG